MKARHPMGLRHLYEYVQPVPEKLWLEMVMRIQNEILDDQSSCLFSNEPFEKKPVITIEDFVWLSHDHFESHLLGNGLCLQHLSHRMPSVAGHFCKRAANYRALLWKMTYEGKASYGSSPPYMSTYLKHVYDLQRVTYPYVWTNIFIWGGFG